MTDNEIIKTLGYCKNGICTHCPRFGIDVAKNCTCYGDLMYDALDLINRLEADKEALIAGQETLQKALAEKNAEIEELTGNLKFVRGTVERQKAEIEKLENEKLFRTRYLGVFPKSIRDEAIKEFAEAVKMEFYKEFDELIPSIMADKIDNLVKEMVGD